MSEKKSETSSGYKRTLSNAHIQLIALGGTIGTGLFLGVGDSIHRAGPSVILIYIIVGIFLFLLMRALGELIMSDLNKHTYIDFIEQYLGKNIGFITGYLYWLSWITLGMAETTALGIYFKYWFPTLKPWIPGIITIVALLIINLISARVFGNLEFSFAIIKTITIVAFVLLILYLLITGGKTSFGPVAFTNLDDHGGFFARGPHGFLQGFQMVIFSFIGVELIGLTAAEVQNPEITLKRAINQLPIRIILFYVMAILGILLVIPWSKVSTNSSPFVQALGATGIPNASSIINFVVISAAVSSTNSFLYSAGRLLFSVTYDGKGKWNKAFGHLSRRQLPQNALILSALLMGCAPAITLVIGDQAFNFISSTATSMFLIIWCLMVLTHISYRRKTPADQLNDFKMPGFPYIDYFILLFFILLIILLLILPSYRIPMIAAIVTFIVLYLISKLWSNEKAV
ncbi:amino acid permease [Lactobacillus helveticus]|jgi:amino acid transporter, AAT family|uniref:APC family amino acid-polyamine-organocation transporter n=2 Tax=Lactobacillus helveticus TaxID=1587 RepID=U4QFJ9_LACHE|nr:amino acid permease [Lactobacillus helveticus]ALI53117.1 D-alanine/D-serine/glycine permease [Lactobacillus helveticus]NRN72605.1 D-serine/D-alanine/glycine transporter [Lactobacillus helveticus]NRN73968.1 D-serine/D-alanine/glycine transporter [Lactobacillus helveticus]NRN76145.1 D-serine/D-alanine/glycine transporter [Lactobacillus helveticus]NRN79235.1 D-serine/D-alanine/glycine transporter [Lactobacillus helveticus]